MAKLIKQLPIEVRIKILTGLHIGAGKDSVKIGGIDAPVVKLHLKNNAPYIPGSSLKGKLRALLEYSEGKIPENPKKAVHNFDIKSCVDDNGYLVCPICKYFGAPADSITKATQNKDKREAQNKNTVNKKLVPIARFLFRDIELAKDWKEKFDRMQQSIDQTFYEEKIEVSINRKTGKANPRYLERVPAGVEFHGTLILRIFDIDLEQYNLPNTTEGIAQYLNQEVKPLFKKLESLLNNDYLGGHGSRGYGNVLIRFIPKEI